MKIKLTEQYSGKTKSVVSLQLGDDKSVATFLNELANSDSKLTNKLQTTLATISHDETYSNGEKFKHLKEGLYEIKIKGQRKALRIYAFLDEIEELENKKLIIVIYPTYKPSNKKKQNRDINTALSHKNRYYEHRDDCRTEWEYSKPLEK